MLLQAGSMLLRLGCVYPWRQSHRTNYSTFSRSIYFPHAFGEGKETIILKSKQVQMYHSIELRAPMNFKTKQQSPGSYKLAINSPQNLSAEDGRNIWEALGLVQAPLFTDQETETQVGKGIARGPQHVHCRAKPDDPWSVPLPPSTFGITLQLLFLRIGRMPWHLINQPSAYQ